MKILFITQDFPPGIGGIQTYSFEHATRLCRKCDDFLMICPGSPDTVKSSEEGLDIKRLDVRSNLLVVPLMRELPGLLAGRPFDVSFHAQWQTAWPAIRARKRGLLKNVFVAAHARELLYNPYRYLPGIGKAYERYRASLLKQVDHFFPVSDYTAGLLKQQGVDASRISVVMNGTDPDLFRPMDVSEFRRRLGLTGKRVVMTVTRLVKRKGIDTVLSAISDLADEFRDLHYVILGTGPEEKRLKQQAARLEISSRVHFLGRIDYHKLPAYYNLADLFVMSSRTELPDVEGFGIVFLEANACEKPVVGTRSGGVPSAIVDGKTGLIVKENDPEELGHAIRSLLLKPERMDEMGKRGRRRVIEEVNWDRLSKTLYEQMERVAGSGKPAPRLDTGIPETRRGARKTDSQEMPGEDLRSGAEDRESSSEAVYSTGSSGKPKRVLMIAPYFLPRRRVGSMRPSRFAAHLSSYGWEPHVITLGSMESLTPAETEWLEGVTVHRIDPGPDRTELRKNSPDREGFRGEGSRLLSSFSRFFDRHCPMDTWLLLFFRELSGIRRIAVQTDPDLIWSTGDPWSGHWLADQIVHQLKRPWITDFRDPWTLGGVQLRERSPFSLAFDRELEHTFLHRSSWSTFTSERTRMLYQKHYPALSFRSSTIPNSFDRDLMQDPRAKPVKRLDPDALTLLFFGSFRELSPAEPLIRILHRFRESEPFLYSGIRVYSAGNLENDDLRLAERLGVLESFHTFEPVPPERGGELLRQADLLLLSTDPRREHIIPAKLWDYLPVERPVLSIAPNPDIGRILKETGTGVQFLPAETEKVARFLADAVRHKRDRKQPFLQLERDEQEIESYESRHTTSQLAELFNKLVDG